MTSIEFQKKIYEKLKIIFPSQGNEELVKIEWNISKGATDPLNPKVRGKIYLPRPDLAVGPFSLDPGVCNYKETFSDNNDFFEKLFKVSRFSGKANNFEDFKNNTNKNPRCLIAIEIEASGTTKHRLGDMVNASLLGKVGVIIPLTEKIRNSFLRIANFFHHAECAGKMPPGVLKNILIIEHDKFEEVLDLEIESVKLKHERTVNE